MMKFDDFLKHSRNGWVWSVPTQFNIAYACLRQHVEQNNGSKTALIIEDDSLGSCEMSYEELDTQSSRFVSALSSLDTTPKDRVLIRLPNSADYPVCFFGCLKHGAIAVPTSTLLAASEVAYLAKDSSAKVLVIAKSMWDELKETIAQAETLTTVLLAGPGAMPADADSQGVELFDLDSLLQNNPPCDAIISSNANDPAYLVYTSGTTGYPKGVLHAHRALLGRLPAGRFWFDFKEGDRILHSGKFNWTYVLGTALMDPLFHGHTVVVHEGKSDAATWPRLIQKHACTIFIGVPTIFRQIIQKTAFAAVDVPSLRHCMSAGEHLSDDMLTKWRIRFGQDIYEALGMSECSYYISTHVEKPIRPGAAGFIQPGHHIEVLDESLKPVNGNEEGVIAIKESDPGLFLGYWRKPEEDKMVRKQGYFITGDYARIDEDGYLWFMGRKDDIINTFGYRVSPHEIERVIKTHPGVADCVALGQPLDAQESKVVVSVCIIRSESIALCEEDILTFTAKNLAQYKVPKLVHFVDQFPRTKNGKVLRRQILQSLIEKNAES